MLNFKATLADIDGFKNVIDISIEYKFFDPDTEVLSRIRDYVNLHYNNTDTGWQFLEFERNDIHYLMINNEHNTVIMTIKYYGIERYADIYHCRNNGADVLWWKQI